MTHAIIIKDAGDECTIEECPPGLFMFEGTLCFKSEYNKSGVFCADTGEYFWGGTSNRDELNKLIVQPMAVIPEGEEK